MLLSENVPDAEYWSVSPFGTEEEAGNTAIETTSGDVTVSTAEPEMAATEAVMFVTPSATPVTRPVASTVATAGLELSHVDVAVWSTAVSSVNTPVADS